MARKRHRLEKPPLTHCNVTPDHWLKVRLASIVKRGRDPEHADPIGLAKNSPKYRRYLKDKPLLDAAWEQWNNKNTHGREILASL